MSNAERINKTLEIVFSVTAMLGSMLVSMTISAGWLIFFVSSVTGTIWAIRTKNNYVAAMNAFFTFTNCMGIWNYVVSPYLATV